MTAIPTTSFNVERVRHSILELSVWDTEDKKASDEIEFSGPDTVPERIRGRTKAFETLVCPSASMEARDVIPKGREAWCEHATSSSARDDRVSDVEAKLSTTHATA